MTPTRLQVLVEKWEAQSDVADLKLPSSEALVQEARTLQSCADELAQALAAEPEGWQQIAALRVGDLIQVNGNTIVVRAPADCDLYLKRPTHRED